MFAYDAMQTMKQKTGEWERQKRALNHRKLIDIAREFVSNIKIKCKKKCLNYPPSPTQFSAEYTVECLNQLSSEPSERFFLYTQLI